MKKAFFCIDGFSFKRMNDYYRYEHQRRSRLNVAALEGYLRYEIASRLNLPSDSKNLVFEKRYYHPSRSPHLFSYKGDICKAILKFESNLEKANYAVHYSEKAAALGSRPNEMLFADSMLAMQLKQFDIFVLLSTQGQHANILQRIKACQIPSVLVGWNAICKNSSGEDSQWKTDKMLRKYASIYCKLEETLNMPKGKLPFADTMFEKFFSHYCPPEFSPRYLLNQRCG
jgi:hypothetical protein